jgi:hypothetical protein
MLTQRVTKGKGSRQGLIHTLSTTGLLCVSGCPFPAFSIVWKDAGTNSLSEHDRATREIQAAPFLSCLQLRRGRNLYSLPVLHGY